MSVEAWVGHVVDWKERYAELAFKHDAFRNVHRIIKANARKYREDDVAHKSQIDRLKQLNTLLQLKLLSVTTTAASSNHCASCDAMSAAYAELMEEKLALRRQLGGDL